MSPSERQRQTLLSPPLSRRFTRRFRRLLSPLLTLLLMAALAAGCAVTPPRSSAIDSALPPELAPREWAGRFLVSSQSNAVDGRQDAAVGRFLLTSLPAPGGRTLDLMLQSPFGQTLANARRLPDGTASLVLADGRTITASSLDTLLAQAIGWPLPLERLTDWLDNRFEQVLARDSAGQVTSATDSGWQISREPNRWVLVRPQPGGQLRVVLVLDR
jgi:outer membrane biogenesis lipoprotein LolB